MKRQGNCDNKSRKVATAKLNSYYYGLGIKLFKEDVLYIKREDRCL